MGVMKQEVDRILGVIRSGESIMSPDLQPALGGGEDPIHKRHSSERENYEARDRLALERIADELAQIRSELSKLRKTLTQFVALLTATPCRSLMRPSSPFGIGLRRSARC